MSHRLSFTTTSRTQDLEEELISDGGILGEENRVPVMCAQPENSRKG